MSASRSDSHSRIPLGARPFAGGRDATAVPLRPVAAEPARPFALPGQRPETQSPVVASQSSDYLRRSEEQAATADQPDDTSKNWHRMASMLEGVAARVRAGQIPVAHGGSLTDETAMLAAVLAALLAAKA